MNWFYENNGASAGPVEDAALQELIAAGTITAATKLWHDGMAGWEPAASVLPDAFPQQAAAPAPQAPAAYPQQPYAQQPYAQQPAYAAPPPKPVKPLPVPASTIAPVWKRCVAYVLDYAILSIPTALQTVSAAVDLVNYNVKMSQVGFGFSSYNFGLAMASIWQLVFFWLYFAAFQSSRFQATPGMMLMNLKVVNADGNRMSFANATGRTFASLLSGLILGIGYLLGLFNPARQCLHDMLAKTYVTDNEAPTEG